MTLVKPAWLTFCFTMYSIDTVRIFRDARRETKQKASVVITIYILIMTNTKTQQVYCVEALF